MANARKRTALTSDVRLNLIIGLTTYLNEVGSATLAELEDHFDVPVDEIRRAVYAMYCATLANSDLDYAMKINDDWRADEVVELQSQEILDGNPRISARQATALATGLTVLAASAAETDKAEIEDLIRIISEGSIHGASPTPVAIVPGTVDADFAKMRQAIIQQKRVSFDYRAPDSPKSSREFDPIKLESNDNVWTVRGFCHLRKEERAFRLDRMQGTQILEVAWSQEARDLELSDRIYEASEQDTKVVIDVEPEAYDLIGNFNAEILENHGAKNEIKRIEISIGYLPNLGKLISVYGGAAKVISPPAAREIVRDFALRALGQQPLETA